MGSAEYWAGPSEGARFALAAAEHGWPVFPLTPGTKTPVRGSNGFLSATDHPAEIRTAFLRAEQENGWRSAGVGVRCTGAAGFCVDLDVKPGQDGIREFIELSGWCGPVNRGHFPSSWTRLRTPSGGMHILFQTPDGPPVHTGSGVLGPGIDLRGPRGYRVMFDPARPNAYGLIGGPRWVLPQAPSWLLERPELYAPPARELTNVDLPPGEMCKAVARASDPDRFDFTDHHSTARRIQHLALLGHEGHPGVIDALVELRPLYVLGRNYKSALDGQPREPEADFDRMVEGALSKGSGAPATVDPCERPGAFQRRFQL